MPTRLPCLLFKGAIRLTQQPFNLEATLRKAQHAGAQTLLLMAGQPPVIRINGKLAPPLTPEPLDWSITQQLAEQLLTDEYRGTLDKSGSAELPFHLAGIAGNLTIFFGNGCHNLVFHITGGN